MTRKRSPSRPWTPDDERRLVEYYRAGLPLDEVSRRLQRSSQAIYVRATKIRKQGTFVCFAPSGRPKSPAWTPDEERRLIDLYSAGLAFREICRRLGRSRDAVSWRASDIRRRGVFVPYAPYPPRKERA